MRNIVFCLVKYDYDSIVNDIDVIKIYEFFKTIHTKIIYIMYVSVYLYKENHEMIVTLKHLFEKKDLI